MIALQDKNIRKILCIRTDRLGETLLTLPAVASLKSSLPKSVLTFLVHPDLVSLIARAPCIDRVTSYEERLKSLWWYRALCLGQRLRHEGFDLAVIFNPKSEFHLATWLAGIPIRVGYDRKWGRLLTHRLRDSKALGGRHEVEYNLDLVQCLGLARTHTPWQFPPFEKEQKDILQMLEQQGIRREEPFVVMHPWSSYAGKEWPIDRYVTLAKLIRNQLSIPTVLIGGPEVKEKAKRAWMAEPHLVNLTGQLTLPQLAGLLQRTQLLISNDSGPVHLAGAVNTKTLVLFGTQDPAKAPNRWGPSGKQDKVIWKDSMGAITVAEVVSLVRENLPHDP